jgi:hypothetical protein
LNHHTKDLSGSNNPSFSHGHALRGKRTSTYQIWEGIKKRCTSPKCQAYKNYGGRGITICDRWLDFANFLSDMGERPNGLCIERVNNQKGYSPENCTWATRKEQAKNRRNTRFVTAFGETLSIAEWCGKTGLSYSTVYLRLRTGKTPEEALQT